MPQLLGTFHLDKPNGQKPVELSRENGTTFLCISQFQLRPAPHPPGYCGAFAHLVSPGGGGICKCCAARGPGICQPRGQPRAFDTHAVSYQYNYTEDFTGKTSTLAHLSRTGKKLKRFVKACSRFYACIFSLLIKPELHGETWELSV